MTICLVIQLANHFIIFLLLKNKYNHIQGVSGSFLMRYCFMKFLSQLSVEEFRIGLKKPFLSCLILSSFIHEVF